MPATDLELVVAMPTAENSRRHCNGAKCHGWAPFPASCPFGLRDLSLAVSRVGYILVQYLEAGGAWSCCFGWVTKQPKSQL